MIGPGADLKSGRLDPTQSSRATVDKEHAQYFWRQGFTRYDQLNKTRVNLFWQDYPCLPQKFMPKARVSHKT